MDPLFTLIFVFARASTLNVNGADATMYSLLPEIIFSILKSRLVKRLLFGKELNLTASSSLMDSSHLIL